MKYNYYLIYEFLEPKFIILITLFLILFDNWGQSIRDGFSRWTIVRCFFSMCVYSIIIYLAVR